MMAFMEILVLLLFSLLLLLIFLYSLSQLQLLINYLQKSSKAETQRNKPLSLLPSPLPKVTIQLPLYNERRWWNAYC